MLPPNGTSGRSAAGFGGDDAHKVADALQAVEFSCVEFDPVFFLDREDDVDLLERVPAGDVLGAQLRPQLDIVG
jgi:hypothetical protein